MKVFTVISGRNVFEIEAKEAAVRSDGLLSLWIDEKLIFAGPSTYTTLIDNGHTIDVTGEPARLQQKEKKDV
jgi:hypothetical protein